MLVPDAAITLDYQIIKYKNYETYNRGEGFQLFARKIRQERSKGNHFLVLIYYYLFTI